MLQFKDVCVSVSSGFKVWNMKKVVILGSTGSIGEHALNIVRSLPGHFEVVGLAAATHGVRVLEQATEFGVRHVTLMDPAAATEIRMCAPATVTVSEGNDGLCQLASLPEADLVVCAIVGMAALKPVLAAISAGHDIAIATKEVLVAAGALICRECTKKGVNLLPIDSEHSALFQALHDSGGVPHCVRYRNPVSAERYVEKTVEKLILTASGGPFFGHPSIDFSAVTVEQTLNHPRWRMGPKVTVDSATMMNKGLEILEARWLFELPVSQIDVWVHPESIVHSLVAFTDGAQIAQLGVPDMRVPIQYAMTWPERIGNSTLPRLDLTKTGSLHFSEPDIKRFPCLRLAREAAAAEGLAPTVMNAANEVAVAAFLEGRIRLPGIWECLEDVLKDCPSASAVPELDEILGADAWARRRAEAIIA